MRVVFFDPIPWDYLPATPVDSGLGGAQSAAIYLAAELARRGHDVIFVNHTKAPGDYDGIRFTGAGPQGTDALLTPADVIIVINAAVGQELRAGGVKAPLVLWAQHAADQPSMRQLQLERAAWSKVVCVSEWQAEKYAETWLADNPEVIYTGVAPCFVAEPIRHPWYIERDPPVLAYTSTPFRGLDVLLEAFPLIRGGYPEATLKVFSSMAVYSVTDDPYRGLYEKARSMEGVEYVGSVGQRALAGELARCAALVYPSTFAETFCIAAAEALAVGCELVTTRLGALPEIYIADAWTCQPDRDGLVEVFADRTVKMLRSLERRRLGAAAERVHRIERYRREFSWSARAVQWERLLEGL